jgi:hypothetical protein
MRTWKLILPAGIVMAGFLVCTTTTYGTPAYMKKENLKSCDTCHTKGAAKTKAEPNLTAIGTCYQKSDHSLAKCDVPADAKKQ